MRINAKPVRWVHGEIKTPPFDEAARIEAGVLLRRVQSGEMPAMPHSRPMPEIAPHAHELRVRQTGKNWRVIYRIDEDAIVVVEVFAKTTRTTPQPVIDKCRRRLSEYDVHKSKN